MSTDAMHGAWSRRMVDRSGFSPALVRRTHENNVRFLHMHHATIVYHLYNVYEVRRSTAYTFSTPTPSAQGSRRNVSRSLRVSVPDADVATIL